MKLVLDTSHRLFLCLNFIIRIVEQEVPTDPQQTTEKTHQPREPPIMHKGVRSLKMLLELK